MKIISRKGREVKKKKKAKWPFPYVGPEHYHPSTPRPPSPPIDIIISDDDDYVLDVTTRGVDIDVDETYLDFKDFYED